MYSAHPSPSHKEKIEYASKRMGLRLECCGVTEQDFVGKDFLDAGCGSGEYSAWFASRGARVTGIDLSDGGLKEARGYAAEHDLPIRFEKRSVLETGFPDESFDFVYSTGVLHHTPDPPGGFRELVRVLRPGGKILISLYNTAGCMPREIRRQVARLLGGDDLDRRVVWGKRLFPFVSKRLVAGSRNDSESALYDYFAIPHESLHFIGEPLRWFEECGLDYQGNFPPAILHDYPAMCRSRAYGTIEKKFQGFPVRMAARIGKGPLRRSRPNFLSRSLVQTLWFTAGINIFCSCARKPLFD